MPEDGRLIGGMANARAQLLTQLAYRAAYAVERQSGLQSGLIVLVPLRTDLICHSVSAPTSACAENSERNRRFLSNPTLLFALSPTGVMQCKKTNPAKVSCSMKSPRSNRGTRSEPRRPIRPNRVTCRGSQ